MGANCMHFMPSYLLNVLFPKRTLSSCEIASPLHQSHCTTPHLLPSPSHLSFFLAFATDTCLSVMGRPPCCDKANVKRGPWTADEDAKILAYVASHGIGNWTLVPEKAGLNRCGKSCRLRWTNYLRPNLRHDNFTPEEEECILRLHETIGNRWSMIANHLPGRTDNDVKNYWNTKLKKKLEKMGIDPITHKPLSQVLTEYKKIGLLKSRNPKTISLHRESIMKAESQFVPPELSHSILMEKQTVEPLYSNCFINNHPWSIMPFQANETINQETSQLHIFSELSSSASSASRSSLTPFSSPQSYPHEVSQVQVATTSSSPWNDYILGDPSFSTDTNIKLGGCEFQATPSNNQLASEENRIFLHEFTTESGNALEEVRQEKGGPVQADHSLETTSSTVDSFVETILARHSEMWLEFPDLLDGCFDY